MSRNKLNLIVDTLGYLAMVCLASTGLTMAYILPPGTGGRHSGEPALTLLGLGRHGWGDVHFYVALALLALMLLHVILHWKWITNTLGALIRRGPARAGAGTGGTALLLLLGLLTAAALAAPWLIPARQAEGPAGRGGQEPAERSAPAPQKQQAAAKEQDGDHDIRGRTTLAEAAQAAGVSVERLCRELNIPTNTDPATGLGHIRRGSGLSMQDIRAVIEGLRAAPTPK
jgi:hypothetical protein